jgi:hypothetical protein
MNGEKVEDEDEEAAPNPPVAELCITDGSRSEVRDA